MLRVVIHLSLLVFATALGGCSAIKREVARESITHQIAGDWRAQGGGAIHLKDDGTFAADLVLGQVQGSWRVEQPLLKLSAANGRQIDLTIARWDFAANPAWMILSTALGETTFYRGGLPAQPSQTHSQSSPPRVTAPPRLSPSAGNWTPNYTPMTCTSCGGGGRCSSCHGGGLTQCFGCGGSGRRQTYRASSDPMGEWSMESCSSCGGSGMGSACILCAGSGKCGICRGAGRL
jgi:hypothetical protein